MRAVVIGLVCAGCAGDPPAPIDPSPAQPGSDAPLSLGAAGAPIEMFGSHEEPTFDEAFRLLSDDGFDSFFPLFVVSEAPEASTYTDHLTHFLSPTLLGAGDALTCRGSANPYAAADGHLKILFPGLVLLGLQDASQPLDTEALATALSTQAQECWSDHPQVVTGFYTYDEPALVRTVSGYVGQPQLDLDNLGVAAEVVRQTAGLEVILVEGPGELGLRSAGLPPEDADRLVASFQADLARIAPTADAMGFNVYPVPDSPLTLPGEYTRTARELAPEARGVSVLQGMGFGRISDGLTPGRAPTLEETRFVAVDSIVSGADELIWYGSSSLELDHPEDAQLWADIRQVVGELDAVSNAIMGDVVGVEASVGTGVRAHQTEDGVVVFIAHRSDVAGEVRLTPSATFSEVTSLVGPPGTLDGNEVTVALPAFGSAILRLR